MANRYKDWLKQAEADLAHAGIAREGGSHEWACFSAQQAAEKALKALFQRLSMEAGGPTLTVLIGNVPGTSEVTDSLLNAARALDKHYILTRDPNGFDAGAPTDFYTEEEARGAIANAELIIEFCRRQIDQA